MMWNLSMGQCIVKLMRHCILNYKRNPLTAFLFSSRLLSLLLFEFTWPEIGKSYNGNRVNSDRGYFFRFTQVKFILRRPQNFEKSSIYFWLQCTQSKSRGWFSKILWPSQNIWTLKVLVSFCKICSKKTKALIEWAPKLHLSFIL